MNAIPVETVCVLAERWPIEPFSGQFSDPVFTKMTVAFQVVFEFKSYSIVEEQNLTIIFLKHNYFWEGDVDQFAQWGRGNGGAEIAHHICQLVNWLVDLIQENFDETDDNPFPHLRHVGMRDFVALDSLCGDRRQNLISYAMLGMDARFAKRSVGIVSRVDFSLYDNGPIEKLKLIRAVELLNSGYQTEALLISFAILDHAVQEVLLDLIKSRGIGKPDGLLNQVKERRLEMYLDPVLKLLTGHSLKEEEPDLWDSLMECNGLRNRAIHDSKDASYESAKLNIETVYDILVYLNSIPKTEAQGRLSEPVFPNLNLKRLPFLLEYE
jgi:hypothetical protein